MVIYTVLNIGSVLPLLLATANGPVAIVVPVMLACQLLSNMLAQGIAGSLYYSKSMRVGTYILSIAAIQLIDVGPSNPTVKVDTMELLSKPLSIAWGILMIGSMVLCVCLVPLVNNKSRDSFFKLAVFATIVSVCAALNNSLSKVLTDVSGNTRTATGILYVTAGATSTIASGYGNAGLNNAMSVPVFTCMQVVVNGLTGIFIWGDAERLTNKIAYVGVYALICTGIYLCSTVEFDFIGGLVAHMQLEDSQSNEDCAALLAAMGGTRAEGRGSFPASASSFSASSFATVYVRKQSRTLSESGLPTVLREFLSNGLQDRRVNSNELLELTCSLANTLEKQDRGSRSLRKVISGWGHDHCLALMKFMQQGIGTKGDLHYVELAGDAEQL